MKDDVPSRQRTEMESRVAKAIWDKRDSRLLPHHRRPFSPTGIGGPEQMEEARAAIRAMREQTEDIKNVFWKSGLDHSGFDENMWSELIDVCSPPEPE